MTKDTMTCDDVIWELGFWMLDHVEEDTLCNLVNAEEVFVECTAKEVYTMMESNDTLSDLLSHLSSRRDHPSARGVHLSGLRETLKKVGDAYGMFSSLPPRQRIESYRRRPDQGEPLGKLLFMEPSLDLLEKEAVA